MVFSLYIGVIYLISLIYSSSKNSFLSFSSLSKAPSSKVWIDLIDPSREELNKLKSKFSLHPLSIDSVFSRSAQPKLESFPNHLFFVLSSVSYDSGSVRAKFLYVFVGEDFLITIHFSDFSVVDELVSKIKFSDDLYSLDFLLYFLLDSLVDSFFPILDSFEDSIDLLESDVLSGLEDHVLKRLYSLKKCALLLRKTISAQRDIFSSISSKNFSKFIPDEFSVYYQDIFNHSIRLLDLVENHREVLVSITDIHLSVTSNKLNEVMKVLTIIATIMMPLTLISGIYGMNFKFMPELSWELGYPFALLLMIFVALIMLFYFKKKRWV